MKMALILIFSLTLLLMAESKKELRGKVLVLEVERENSHHIISSRDSVIDLQKQEISKLEDRVDTLTSTVNSLRKHIESFIQSPKYNYFFLVDKMKTVSTLVQRRNLIKEFELLAKTFGDSIAISCNIRITELKAEINSELNLRNDLNRAITPTVKLEFVKGKKKSEKNAILLYIQYKNHTPGKIIGIEIEIKIFTPFGDLIHSMHFEDEIPILPYQKNSDDSYYLYKAGTRAYGRLLLSAKTKNYTWQAEVKRIVYSD